VLTVLVLGGIGGLVAGFFGARHAQRVIRSQKLGWWRVQSLPLALGVGACITLAFRRYQATPTTEVLGVPFPVAAFEGGHDFIGITSLPFALANMAFFLLLPQLGIALYFRLRSGQTTSKAVPTGARGVYVLSECCLDCGVPWTVAPEIFAEGEGSCIVRRQPSGPTELRRVLRVFRNQDLNCIRYGGRNRRAIAILKRAGCADACDE
jgi:hypothetical protein